MEVFNLFKRSLRRFLSLSFILASMILVVRVYDLIIISNSLNYPAGATANMLIGLKFDLLFYLQISGILLLPFLLIAYFNQKAAKYFFITFSILITLSQMFLLQYFSITKIPFSTNSPDYSLSEFLNIFNFSNGIPLFSYFVLILYLTYMTRVFIKHVYFRIKPWAMVLLTVLMLSSVFSSKQFVAKQSDFNDEFGYYVAINKLHYFAQSLFNYYL